MNEFLEHFGGVVVAIIVASVLSTMLIFTRDKCNAILNDQVIASADCEQEYTDVSNIINEDAPELTVVDSITVELNKEFDPKDAVVSAYDKKAISINEISGDAAKNITNIKKALLPGKVNVIYPAKFSTAEEGNYKVIYYAKNNSKSGLWTRRKCLVTVVKYETAEEEG